MVAAGKRVLIMDDDQVVRRSYERVLSEAGYHVRSARSGPDALEKAQSSPVDVLMADLRMPGMDGMTAIRHLRERQPEVRIIIITGYPSQESIQEATRLGVQDYLTKPVPPDALTRATMEALAKAPPPIVPETTVPSVSERSPGTTAALAPDQEPLVAATAVVAKPTQPTGTPVSLKDLPMLILAPFIGLAYVLILPFAGILALLGLAAAGLFTTVRSLMKV
ncbi:MAG: response regulator [Planctomycetota bacterium]|jgi:CheY-like chemotaxis protein